MTIAYERRLSPSSIAVLCELLGRNVCTFYASRVDVSGRQVAAPALSLSLFDPTEAVTVRAEYFETPHYLNDYWELIVHRQRYPYGIEVRDGAMIDPCGVYLWPNAAIASVSVYEFTSEQDDLGEQVAYDQGLRFVRSDGRSFAIACLLSGPGLACDVHYTDDEQLIESWFEQSKVRLEFG